MTYGIEFLAAVKTASFITVTGPQRSGTRIATAILARDLGRRFIGEEDYRVSLLEGRLIRFLELAKGDPAVAHAPTLSSVAQHLPGHVVFMRRPLYDIVNSQVRIDWAWEKMELEPYFTTDGPVAAVKYKAWDKFQKRLLERRGFDLDYESLRGHPLWVEKSHRALFHPHQLGVDGRTTLGN